MEPDQIWLWPEWYYALHTAQTPLFTPQKILLFGSAFDRSLWQLFAYLWSYLDHFPAAMDPQTRVNLVFLPISRHYRANHQFKLRLETHLVHSGQLKTWIATDQLPSQMEDVLRLEWKVIESSLTAFSRLARENGWDQLDEARYRYKRDVFLYGSLTAKLLTEFSPLPMLQLGTYTFHGIPHGISLEELCQTYVDPLLEAPISE